jgi:hypothetical protein
MEETTKIIAVVRGASNLEIQAIFRALADKWQPDVRLAGLAGAGNRGMSVESAFTYCSYVVARIVTEHQ